MPSTKTRDLRRLITTPQLSFLMEAHNGLSAKIAEEAGFEGIWGSGLSLSASMGVRDNNEMSWTQVLDIVEFMNDATCLPILLDGDTGYGNFNNMRRLVKKLESIGVAGVCIEDKLFPKTNSFIAGENQPLADIDEFCGKIKAGKDAQTDEDFCIVARVEAFIAGWGLTEAVKRAEAYRKAGADAILIHSALKTPDEILAFKREWGDRLPVVIVPTKYYATPTELFREAGFNLVIWANHLMRASATAMKHTAAQIFADQSLLNVEDKVVSVAEVFRLQGAAELEDAETRYLPAKAESTKALVLAAARGKELGQLTESRPKAMVPVSGAPLLVHLTATLNAVGIKNVTVVRGYKKEAIDLPNTSYVDNDRYATTQEVFSMWKGLRSLPRGSVMVSYGDVIYQKYIALNLLESDADITLAVDAAWQQSRNKGRYGDYVTCARPYARAQFNVKTELRAMSNELDSAQIHGEWIGLMRLSPKGFDAVLGLLNNMEGKPELERLRMSDLFNQLVAAGQRIDVIYTVGHWLDVDELEDVVDASEFV